jgi:transposase-like protein
MSKAPAKKVGRRYSAEERTEIVAFVKKHNADNGRGGQSAAVAKFKVSALTLSSWIKAGDIPSYLGKKRGRKPGTKNKVADTSSGRSFAAKLKTLAALAEQIDRAESDLSKLKGKFQILKTGL